MSKRSRKNLVEKAVFGVGEKKEERKDGYSRYGVTRGVLQDGWTCQGKMGVVAKGYPFWALTAANFGCKVGWILLGDRKWIGRVGARWPNAQVRWVGDLKLVEVMQLIPVDVVGFDDHVTLNRPYFLCEGVSHYVVTPRDGAALKSWHE